MVEREFAARASALGGLVLVVPTAAIDAVRELWRGHGMSITLEDVGSAEDLLRAVAAC